MNTPEIYLWDSLYPVRWREWAAQEIKESNFQTSEECLKYIMKKSNGRMNPRVVMDIYEESKINNSTT